MARLFKFLYKARKYHLYHDPKYHISQGPWVTALLLILFYGLGFPTLILVHIRRRRRRFQWVPLSKHPHHGRYEAREGEVQRLQPKAGSVYNFLQLEQQVREGKWRGDVEGRTYC